MTAENLNLPSEKDKQAVALRSKGHTYAYVAEELGYKNPAAAREAITAVLRDADIAPLTSMDDDEFNAVYELKIRLQTVGGDPRVPFRIRLLMEALYEAEAQWEKSFREEEDAGNLILTGPTTFSVSKVMVDQAPQTGKHIIFPEV